MYSTGETQAGLMFDHKSVCSTPEQTKGVLSALSGHFEFNL